MISHQFTLKMLFGLGFFEILTMDLGYFVFFTTNLGYCGLLRLFRLFRFADSLLQIPQKIKPDLKICLSLDSVLFYGWSIKESTISIHYIK